MKSTRNYRQAKINFFSCLFLIILPLKITSFTGVESNLSPGEQAVIATSIFAVGTLATGIAHYFFSAPTQNDFDFIKKTYPYALLWFESLNQKYPDLHVTEKEFLCGSYSEKEYHCWKSSFNQIYCPDNFLLKINVIYKKIMDRHFLTEDEMIFLSVQEFMILQQIGIIEQEQIVQRYIYACGIAILLEGIKTIYKNYTDDDVLSYYKGCNFYIFSGLRTSQLRHYDLSRLIQDPDNSLIVCVDNNKKIDRDEIVYAKMIERNQAFYLGELIAGFLLFQPIYYMQKLKAYEFACAHADHDLLDTMIIFYQAFIYKKELFVDPFHYRSTVNQWYYDMCGNPDEFTPLDCLDLIHAEFATRF